MIKLKNFSPISYTVIDFKDGRVKTVGSMSAELVNTKTKEVIKKFRGTGFSICSPEDEYDEKLGHDLATTRTMQSLYANALDYALDQCEDSIKWIACVCELDTLLNREFYHEDWLFDNTVETPERPNAVAKLLANIEVRLPLFKDCSDEVEYGEEDGWHIFSSDYWVGYQISE